MNDSGGDMDQGTFENAVLHAIETHCAAAIEDVIEFGGTLVEVQLRSIDVDGVGPRCWRKSSVFAANQAVPPTASAPLSRRMTLVTNKEGSGN